MARFWQFCVARSMYRDGLIEFMGQSQYPPVDKAHRPSADAIQTLCL
jgi:hypothetical protein